MGNLKFFYLKFNYNVQNWIPWKPFWIIFCSFLPRILCLYIFILQIFSITGQCCHFLNHLKLLFPKQCTYYVMCGYLLQCVCFHLSARSAQSALNPQHFNKYFDIVYNNFHIFIELMYMLWYDSAKQQT